MPIVLAGLLIIVVILGVVILAPRVMNLAKHPDQLKQMVLRSGVWAPLVMITVQAIQVILAPVPGQVISFVSGYVFGAVKGTILSMIGLTIGALLAFLLARLTGRKLLKYFLSEAALKRVDTFTLKRGPFVLFLLLIIPNPLGDGVYYLAGLTNIPLLFFLVTVIISRFPSSVINNLIGAKVTSFTIYHWLAFGIVLLALVLLYYLYNKRIEEILLRLTRIKDKDK